MNFGEVAIDMKKSFDFFLLLRRGDPQFFAAAKIFDLSKPVFTISPLLAMQAQKLGYKEVNLMLFNRKRYSESHYKVNSLANQLASDFDAHCSELRVRHLDLPVGTRGWIFYYLKRLIVSQFLLRPCSDFFDTELPKDRIGLTLYPEFGQIYDFDCRTLRNLALPKNSKSSFIGAPFSLYPMRVEENAYKKLPLFQSITCRIEELVVAPALYPESQRKIRSDSSGYSVLLESPVYNNWLPKNFSKCTFSSSVFEGQLPILIPKIQSYLDNFEESIISFFRGHGLVLCPLTLKRVKEFNIFQTLLYYLLLDTKSLRDLKFIRMSGEDDGLIGPVSSFAFERKVPIKTYGHTHFEVDFFPLGSESVYRSNGYSSFVNIPLQLGHNAAHVVDTITFPPTKEPQPPLRIIVVMSSLDDTVETPYFMLKELGDSLRAYLSALIEGGCIVKIRPRFEEYWDFLFSMGVDIECGPIEEMLDWPDYAVTFGQVTSALTLFRAAGSKIHFLSLEVPTPESLSRIPIDTSIFVSDSLPELFSSSLREII